jgi:hypothetical protein
MTTVDDIRAYLVKEKEELANAARYAAYLEQAVIGPMGPAAHNILKKIKLKWDGEPMPWWKEECEDCYCGACDE